MEQREEHPPRQATDVLNAEILATIGQELRGPLASIKGYTATLLRREFLLAIHDASERLEAIY